MLSPLAVQIGAGALALLALIALRGKRWAYFGFVLLAVAYFPAQAHFHVHAPKCVQVLPTVQQLVPLLYNYVYIALFAGFYWMSWVQFRESNARIFWALVATLLAAALFEIAQGMTAVVAVAKTAGHAKAAALAARTPCRVQDLVAPAAGALAAALLLAIWSRLTRKPGYVRLVKRGAAAAPRRAPAAPPSPLSGLPTLPRAAAPAPLPSRVVPPPPDFSPGPGPLTPVEDLAPTEEVAARKQLSAARQALMKRLYAIRGRLRMIFQRAWAILLRRRRAVAIGLGVLVLAAAAAFVIPRVRFSKDVATAEADSTAAAAAPLPPPPPPRQLQSEVVGYYEPSYRFTVFDRRFTRLTLRPEPSVMFTRPGVKQQVACEDSRIGQDNVRLRCTLEPYGVVTIEGRFPTRYATSKLDMPVLSAVITVTNNRGEVQYRARDSFYWHVPDPSQ
jgi:hypothetical protein